MEETVRQYLAGIGRKGGQSVPGHKRHFTRNPEAAKAAGRKGGLAAQAKRKGEGK